MVCAPVQRDNPRALASGLSTVRRTNMLYLTCTMMARVDFTRNLMLKIWYLGIVVQWLVILKVTSFRRH